VSSLPFRRGVLVFHPARRTVHLAGEIHTLTPILFDLLLGFAWGYPYVVHRIPLERRVWPDGPPATNALGTHIGRLRLALRGSAVRVESAYGVGYRLVFAKRSVCNAMPKGGASLRS
jgi:DNA-binding response OmpR family regulator